MKQARISPRALRLAALAAGLLLLAIALLGTSLLGTSLLRGALAAKGQAQTAAAQAEIQAEKPNEAIDEIKAAAPARPEKFLDIELVKTPENIDVWLARNDTLPVVAVRFAFRGAGAAADPADRQGLAQLLSNTLDEGAGEYDSQTFQKILADNSIDLSFGASRDSFTGSIRTLSRNKDLAFSLMGAALSAPRFDAEPVERMKAANIARIKSQSTDPQWIAARLTNDIAYQGHPYALNSGGTLTTLPAITAEDLRAAAQARLARGNLLVVMAGDMTADEARKAVTSMFGRLPEKAELPEIPDLSLQNGGSVTLYKLPIPQTIISITHPGIAREHPDFYTAYVLNFILGGGGFGSRLMEEIREKRGLTYGIYSGMESLDHIATLNISTSTKNETAGEVLALIRQGMESLSTDPVDEKTLAEAKSFLTGSMPLSLTSTAQIASLLLSLRLEDLPITYLDDRAEKINAVTASDITALAGRWLRPAGMTTILVGDPQNADITQTRKELPNVD